MLLLVLILGMDQLLGIDLTLDLLLGLLLALHMAYMDHEGLGHAHERQNQALDHYSKNLDLDRSKQLDTLSRRASSYARSFSCLCFYSREQSSSSDCFTHLLIKLQCQSEQSHRGWGMERRSIGNDSSN